MPKSVGVPPLRRSTRSNTCRYWEGKVSKSDKTSKSVKVSKSAKVSKSVKVSKSFKASKSDKVISTCGSTSTSKSMTTPGTPEHNFKGRQKSDSPLIIPSNNSIEKEESTATLCQSSGTKPPPPKDTEEDISIKEDTGRVLFSQLPSNISVTRVSASSDQSPRMSGSAMTDQDNNDTSSQRMDVNSANLISTSLPVDGQEESVMEAQAQAMKPGYDQAMSNKVLQGLSSSISITRSPAAPSAAHRLPGSGFQVQDEKCGGKEIVDLTGCEDTVDDDQICIVEELYQKELKVKNEVKVENENVTKMGGHEQGMEGVGHSGKASHKMVGGMRHAGGMRQLSPGSCGHARFGGGGYYNSFRGGNHMYSPGLVSITRRGAPPGIRGGAMAGRGRARMMLTGNVIPMLRAQQHLPFTTPARHMTTPPARGRARLATPAKVSLTVAGEGKQVRIELNKKQTEALRKSLNE